MLLGEHWQPYELRFELSSFHFNVQHTPFMCLEGIRAIFALVCRSKMRHVASMKWQCLLLCPRWLAVVTSDMWRKNLRVILESTLWAQSQCYGRANYSFKGKFYELDLLNNWWLYSKNTAPSVYLSLYAPLELWTGKNIDCFVVQFTTISCCYKWAITEEPRIHIKISHAKAAPVGKLQILIAYKATLLRSPSDASPSMFKIYVFSVLRFLWVLNLLQSSECQVTILSVLNVLVF